MANGTVNNVILVGRLGQDPELRQANSGTAVCNFTIATTELGPKTANGTHEKTTEWHNITVFGNKAVNASQYLQKGSKVYIGGHLTTQNWIDKETGKTRYKTIIIGHDMQFLDSKDNNQNPQQNTGYHNQTQIPNQHNNTQNNQQQNQNRFNNNQNNGFNNNNSQTQTFNPVRQGTYNRNG